MINKISYYNNLKITKPNDNKNIEDIFDIIYGNSMQDICNNIRQETDKKKRTILKHSLPAVTFSGTFTERKNENLTTHSGLICIDIDDIKNVMDVKIKIENDKNTFAVFVSPSGNGLKVIYKIDIISIAHLVFFNAIASYIKQVYSIDIDQSGKDVARLCFLSYDPTIYINNDCNILSFDFVKQNQNVVNDFVNPSLKISTKIDTTQQVYNNYSVDVYDMCDKITQRTQLPTAGNYNNYILNYARYACRYGIAQTDCVTAIQKLCSAHDIGETTATVKSVYGKYANEFNTWIYKETNKNEVPHKKIPYEKKPLEDFNEDVEFWYEVKNEKTGKVEYRFSYDDAIIFLENNGFYKYPLEKGFYQFIRVQKDIKQVEVIQPLSIKEFFLDYLKSNDSTEYKALREMFRRGAKNYCSLNLLEGLDYYKPDLKKDTKITAFVYFTNCYLEISASETKTQPYKNLDGFIWKKQIIDFDYTYTAHAQGDFSKFVFLVMIGEKKTLAECTDIELQKLNSFSSTIGYLLHKFKNPALTKAVVAVDKCLRLTGEQNGRTGKSLLSKAIAKMMNVCLIDGKLFGFDKPFPFQKASLDTELINFNDVKKNFDFESLFGMITEEFCIEYKGQKVITLDFESSPKFYISTNNTLKGSGESNKGRQQIIEFADYFNTNHTPVIEFGRMFFSEWDAEQFSMFYSYMIDCISYFLKNGLVDFPLENYAINKLIDTAGEEFLEYMDETVLAQLKFEQEYDCQKLFDSYIAINKHKDKTMIKTFNKNVKSWADLHSLHINAHKQGERDRRNNISYFTFTHATNKPVQPVQIKSSLPF